MSVVMITGSSGAAAVAVIKALSSTGYKLFAAASAPTAAGLYLVPAEQRVLVPRASAPDFADVLLRMARKRGVSLVIPTDDAEVMALAEARRSFETEGIQVAVASVDALQTVQDRLRLACACADLWAPRTTLHTVNGDGPRYPVFARARFGDGRGGRLVRCKADLEGLATDGSCVLQEYLPGESYCVEVLAEPDGAEALVAVPRLRIRSHPTRAARTLHDPELEGLAMLIIERLGVGYSSSVHFRRDALGRPRVVDVLPRFTASTMLTCAAGVSMPEWVARRALGEEPEPPTGFREVAMVRHVHDVMVSCDEFRAMRALHVA